MAWLSVTGRPPAIWRRRRQRCFASRAARLLHVRALDHRLEQPIFRRLFGRREHVVKRAGHLERVEKLFEVGDLTSLDTHADDEAPVLLESRLYFGDAHVFRQRLLELRQQIGPRERPHFDDRLGFSGRCRRSEEHTSELQSQSNLVCRLLLEKKKNNTKTIPCTINKLKALNPQPQQMINKPYALNHQLMDSKPCMLDLSQTTPYLHDILKIYD